MTSLLRPRAGVRAAFSIVLTAAAAGWPRVSNSQEKPSVLVTASRETESLAGVLWSSDVLTRPEIEASQALSVQDLLGELPGVQIHNAGGLGKQTSLFVRGMNADQVLLLVNGVRVGSATTGLPPIELIPVDQIERIEVVRGPRSALYGSDAMGGVIQIFTRGGAPHGFSADASATGGTYSTFDESLSLGGGLGPVRLAASGEVLHTAGFQTCSGPSVPGQPATDCLGEPADRDGFLNRSGSFTAGVRFGAGWSASVDSLVTSGHTDYDGTYSDSTAFAERVTSLHVDGPLTGGWSLHALAGRNVDDAHDFLAGAQADRFETRRNSASLQLDGGIVPALRAVVGSDWYSDRIGAYEVLGGVISPVQFQRTTRDTTGTFLELHGATGAWTELAGVRFEHNTQYGDHVTEDLGVGWTVDRHLRLTATWGTAFHAPTFNDLYYPSFPGFPPSSNPRLRPEVSHSVELGADGSRDALSWSLHVYQTEVRHLITYAPPDYTPVNLDEARIRGVELRGRWRRGSWTLAGQASALEPVDRSPRIRGNPDTLGNLLPRRAQSSAFLDVRRSFGRSASIAVRGRWQGRRFDDLANTVPLGGYFLLDVLADVQVWNGWSLEGRVANAFDRGYHTAANANPLNPFTYYDQPGRELDLTVRYRFRSSAADGRAPW